MQPEAITLKKGTKGQEIWLVYISQSPESLMMQINYQSQCFKYSGNIREYVLEQPTSAVRGKLNICSLCETQDGTLKPVPPEHLPRREERQTYNTQKKKKEIQLNLLK